MANYCCRACQRAGRVDPRAQALFHATRAHRAATVAWGLSWVQLALYVLPPLAVVCCCGGYLLLR